MRSKTVTVRLTFSPGISIHLTNNPHSTTNKLPKSGAGARSKTAAVRLILSHGIPTTSLTILIPPQTNSPNQALARAARQPPSV
ncbi:hypothetical protein lbkm_0544 [Lachnospiraceae bacterium KM106-2]|nr:hypothetical protein lbkm_0544 [Lachnospiraceae bacterium KM106-2]